MFFIDFLSKVACGASLGLVFRCYFSAAQKCSFSVFFIGAQNHAFCSRGVVKMAPVFFLVFSNEKLVSQTVYFSGAAFILQFAGISSSFLPLLFSGLSFWRSRLGAVAKIDFQCFRCGFVVVGNVRFSFGGGPDFVDLGKFSRFYCAFS